MESQWLPYHYKGFDIKKFLEFDETIKTAYVFSCTDFMTNYDWLDIFQSSYTPSLIFLETIKKYAFDRLAHGYYFKNRLLQRLSQKQDLSIECLLNYQKDLYWDLISAFNKNLNEPFIEQYFHLLDLNILLKRHPKDLNLSKKLKNKLTIIHNFQTLLKM